MAKSELAIKRDEWFDSDEGKGCMDAKSLELRSEKYRYFIKNRLERAFLAGAQANEEVRQEICDKLADNILSDTP